jgi:hypothetical protein
VTPFAHFAVSCVEFLGSDKRELKVKVKVNFTLEQATKA